MGKKGSSVNKKGPVVAAYPTSMTLREETSGKKQGFVSAKSTLKMEHMKNLAIWAGNESSIPSLGAFFGHRLAATAEALDVPSDPSLFSCQRCESILQPGYNCTVRIEKNKAKKGNGCRKPNLATQNNVVFRCHFCSHRNLKRGTPMHYMKDLCPPNAKPILRSDPMKKTIPKGSKPEVVAESKDNIVKMDRIALPGTAGDKPVIYAPETPVTRLATSFLDTKRRKRTRPGPKKAFESGSASAAPGAENATGAPSKRRRKCWTSLKEIAECDEQQTKRNFSSLAIPFII